MANQRANSLLREEDWFLLLIYEPLKPRLGIKKKGAPVSPLFNSSNLEGEPQADFDHAVAKRAGY
jgi:hypothetical protein